MYMKGQNILHLTVTGNAFSVSPMGTCGLLQQTMPCLSAPGGRVGVSNNDGNCAGSALQEKGKILAILIKTWLVNTHSGEAFLYKIFAHFYVRPGAHRLAFRKYTIFSHSCPYFNKHLI